MCGILSVSYTHLDVYKRQPEFNSLIFDYTVTLNEQNAKKIRINAERCV